MAKSISTTYYPEATAKCLNCGSVYTLGLTQESFTLEICGNCHPFYTGKEVLVDTAGRVDKFMKKLSLQKDSSASASSKKGKVRKIRQNVHDPIDPTPTTKESKNEAKTEDKSEAKTQNSETVETQE
jgi:large subunit ribosomal protein L31